MQLSANATYPEVYRTVRTIQCDTMNILISPVVTAWQDIVSVALLIANTALPPITFCTTTFRTKTRTV